MTVRVSTTFSTVPADRRRHADALAYRRAFAHGVRVGLTGAAARAAIGELLRLNVADQRATDWGLLCDFLTALADEQKRKDRLMNTTESTVDDGEPWHDCPGGCGRSVPDEKVACKDCFSLLPLDLQAELRTARGEDRADAGVRAVAWMRAELEGGKQKNPPKGTYSLAGFGGYPRGGRRR